MSLSAHTARTLSEIERHESAQLITVQDRNSIPLAKCRTVSLHQKENISIESIYMKSDSMDHGLESLSKSKRRWLVFRKITYIIIMNGIIPIVLYYVLKEYLPKVWALVISNIPTIISVIIQAIFLKRIDSLGIGVIFGFLLSLILAVLNQDPKLLLLRESFVTAGVGVICGLTLLPIKYKSFRLKPVLFYLAKDLIPLQPVHFLDESKPKQERMDFYWIHSPFCRYHFRLLTAIDVVILELEFGLKLYYIQRFNIDTVVILSNSTLTVIGILFFISTIGYIIQIRRRLKKDEPQMLMEAEAIH